ncbi:MAG: hypothetical protein J5382_10290 [Bacteroidales bacterium]|nr:hypothetical protein [Bacteroidales bacterium]
MPSTRDIKRILIGGNDVKRVMYRDAQVWPTAYTAVLEVVWVFGGQYAINAIPAGGGTATAQIWSLSIYRQSDGQLVDTVPVTPTVTIGDTTNFSYDAATGVWRANDRERNGINSASGQTAPSNAPARSCTLHAAVQYTYHGVNVSASYDTTMTQNENKYKPGTAYYTNLRVALNRYNSSASPAPAYESTATISASLDQNTPGVFSSGSAYTYIQPNAVGSNRFSFTESASWLSISGTTVTVYGRGTDNDASRYASILATFTGDTSIKSSVTLYQRDNYRYEKSRTYSSYETLLSDSRQGLGHEGIEIPKEGGYVYLIGTAWYDVVYGWPSNAPDTTGRDYRSQDPTYIYSDPSSGVTIDTSNARVQLPANSTSTPKEYDLWGAYTDGGVTRSSDRYSATVLGVSQEYGIPVVSIEYDEVEDGCGYQIWAAAGSARPTVSFSQPIMQGGTVVGYVRGSLANGATSGTADDGTPFSVSFSGTGANGGSVASGGTVSVGSRGTRPGDSWNVATDIKAVVVCHGIRGESNTVSAVVQQENRPTPFSAYDEYYSARIGDLRYNNASGAVVPLIISAKAVTIYVEFTASWGHYDAGVEYTSREKTGGDYTYHDNEAAVPYRLEVDGGGFYDTNTFTASNQHSLSSTSHSIKAVFGAADGPYDTKTLLQAADSKKEVVGNYAVSLELTDSDIWAGGGSGTLVSYATHELYYKWNSDDSTVEGSVETVYDTSTLVEQGTISSRFHIGSRRTATDTSGHLYCYWSVTHDDMQKNAATDSMAYKARHDESDLLSTEVRRAILNQLETSQDPVYGSWVNGSAYPESSDYGIKTFTINDYNTSASPASFKGAEAGYTVVGRHYDTRKRDDTRNVYTKYTSWSSANNDDNHRALTGTDSRTVVISGPTEVTGDTVNLTTTASWVTINTSQSKLVLDAQSSTGRARYATIRATNAGGGATLTADVYQAGYANLSSNKTGISFNAAGGTNTFIVTSRYTDWTIDYPRAIFGQNPFLGLRVGGSDANHQTFGDIENASSVTTVSVSCGSNDLATMLRGVITLTPNAPGTDASDIVRVTIDQLAQS